MRKSFGVLLQSRTRHIEACESRRVRPSCGGPRLRPTSRATPLILPLLAPTLMEQERRAFPTVPDVSRDPAWERSIPRIPLLSLTRRFRSNGRTPRPSPSG